MENCIISNVMTRRVSERIQKQRDGFLILVEEYSGTDSDSESELEEDTPFRGRGTTRLKTQTNRDRLYMDGVKLSTKLNTFSQNLVQVNPEEKTQVSKIPPTCYTCNGIFNTIDELYFHGLAHSTKSVQCQETFERESYKCNICNAILKDRSFVRLHVAKHNYIRCQCILCPKTFCSPSYLSQHIKHEHEGIKYTCPHCPKSYTQNANLKQHMLSHEGVYFTCYHCGREFTNRALLVRHMGVHKENRKRYKCKVCKRSMICPKAYKKHMKYHQGLSEFVCLICAKKFMDKHTFVRHMDRHESPTEYKCNVCKRTYVDKKLLERHVLRHFREDFVCDICGKAYVDQKVLDDHVLQHEGHTYPCDQCDNTYTYLCKYFFPIS